MRAPPPHQLPCAPGMMYVSDRSADSICETALAFLVMKSEYMPSHRVGSDSTWPVVCVACLYMVAAAMGRADRRAGLGGEGSRSRRLRGTVPSTKYGVVVGCRGTVQKREG